MKKDKRGKEWKGKKIIMFLVAVHSGCVACNCEWILQVDNELYYVDKLFPTVI